MVNGRSVRLGGGRILVALDREPLAIALSVVAVGAHFLPFARAFCTPMFAVLGWVMVPLGLVGLLVGWTVDPRAAAAAAVPVGLAMLVIIVVDAHRPIRSIRGFPQGLRTAAE